ncbi:MULTISPECIES: hypothetical protein [unclassified Streptomyces]|uniref:hypothetical protein n=1 Tax=unclassified Streptomyces TaxID=2593676 RepID=UPI000DC7BA18|nr:MULTISPECIES: hypothetical protein [unclassified Streptomyces]AWZ03926.1 hypothetical protein DRB89_03935 [Streptomyces sp. ICC4]AWZ13035.1 hypothetical protein DRB96_12730 [Streptomyces sp. ICC1]
MNRLLATAVSTAAAALLVAGGAASASAEPTDDATKELCSSLTELKADNAKLRTLDPATATKDQIKDAHNAVQDDWKTVAESTAQFNAAQKDAIKSAANDVKKAYDDLPGDTTGADALTKLTPDLQKLDTAVASAQLGLQCG